MSCLGSCPLSEYEKGKSTFPRWPDRTFLKACITSTVYEVLEMSEKKGYWRYYYSEWTFEVFSTCDVQCILLCGETKAAALAVIMVGCTLYYAHLLSRIMVWKGHQTIVWVHLNGTSCMLCVQLLCSVQIMPSVA